MKLQFSTKRIQVDKNNAMTMGIVAAAAFIATFSIVASKALLSKQAYQSRVIAGKETAVDQLKANKEAVNTLVEHYKEFINKPTNILGGTTAGQGDKDGDNARIILDALPSKYDFPALATSIEKIFADNKFTLKSIEGTDDEIAQNKTTVKPIVIEIPFSLSSGGNYGDVGNILALLEKSIRPISVQSISLSGSDNDMLMNLKLKTFYLPEKSLTIDKKVVK